MTDVAFHSTHRKGYQSKLLFFHPKARVVDLVPEACSTTMTEDRHDELAAIDLSTIAVALTSSYLVCILTVMSGYIFRHSFFFCFVFEHETLYTIQVLTVFDFYYRKLAI